MKGKQSTVHTKNKLPLINLLKSSWQLHEDCFNEYRDLCITKLELSCLHSLHLDADIKFQGNNYAAKQY